MNILQILNVVWSTVLFVNSAVEDYSRNQSHKDEKTEVMQWNFEKTILHNAFFVLIKMSSWYEWGCL